MAYTVQTLQDTSAGYAWITKGACGYEHDARHSAAWSAKDKSRLARVIDSADRPVAWYDADGNAVSEATMEFMVDALTLSREKWRSYDPWWRRWMRDAGYWLIDKAENL